MDAGAMQRLVGVDVAHARDPALVEQQRLDRRGPPARERAQVLGREALVQRLEPQAGREERLQRLAAEQQLAGAEAPRIDDHQPPLGAQLDAHAHVRRLGLGAHTARPPVMRRCWTRWTSPCMVQTRYLPRRRSASMRLPTSASLKFMRRQRPRPARVEDLHRVQPAPLHQRRQLASDRLHLRQLGHRRKPSACRDERALAVRRARVRAEVGVLQALGGEVRVDLGGGEVGVAEHLLQRAQVAAAREQVRGKGVAQRVRAHLLLQSDPSARGPG